MDNMREYWAREAEMMRDKSAVLGTTVTAEPNMNDTEGRNFDVIDVPKGVRYDAEIKILDERLKILQVDFKLNASIKVVKCTNSGFELYQVNAFSSELKVFLEKIFGFKYTIEDYLISNDLKTGQKLKKNQSWQIKCNLSPTYNIEPAGNFNLIKSTDLIMVVVDSLGATSVSESGFNGKIVTGGFHTAGGRIMVLSKDMVSSQKRNAIIAIAHEEGHRLGLSHDHNSGGIMSYKTMYSSSDISQGQKKGLAFGAFWSPYRGLKYKIGKFSESPSFGDAKAEVTDWLDKAKGEFSSISYKTP